MLFSSGQVARSFLSIFVLAVLSCALAAGPVAAQVAGQQEVTEGIGGFPTSTLDADDSFGRSVARLGTLSGMNGTEAVAVGAYLDDADGKTNVGSVWIVSLNENGVVQDQQQITSGDFGGGLDPGDEFGVSVDSIGDLDNDGVNDLAVGARFDEDGASRKGAVWILFLNADGTVSSTAKISDATSPEISLNDGDQFGQSVVGGDLDGDGTRELAVGASGTNEGKGAVWLLEPTFSGGTLSVTVETVIDNNTANISLDNNATLRAAFRRTCVKKQ